MTYIDATNLIEAISNNSQYGAFISKARNEVDDYFRNFNDDPVNISRWAHHYFCKAEGGLLIYNDITPHSHICSICGQVYSNDLLNGVWHTMYRNQGVMNAWKSALIFKVSDDRTYLDHVLNYARFYNDHYTEFRLHNKEGLEFDSLEEALWGTSRIMPQSLNESIFIIRLINALEMVREDLPDGFLETLEKGIFSEAFRMFQPQVDKIHNIPTWLNCGIGVMGLFLGNREMTDFAFNGPFGVTEQLKQGVTEDFFWYEGSIHYNFFLLEGVVNLLLFSEIYNYDFSYGKGIVDRMLQAAYNYAFDNHRLPNPNDGWPDVNLKTYSYIYAAAVKVLGEESECGLILGSILNQKGERGTVPLSKPYYYNNDLSLEEFLFTPYIRHNHRSILVRESFNFKSSYCAVLKSSQNNVFLKYGHNGPSHAHPDKMNIEVQLKGVCLSRDLSNSGYGNVFCNEWHRVSASHNTVVVDGKSHSGFGGGTCEIQGQNYMSARTPEVYPGVAYRRDIRIKESGFADLFDVSLPAESICDYFFHVEGSLTEHPRWESASLGFDQNGYQYLTDIHRIPVAEEFIELVWRVKGCTVLSRFSMKDKELYVMKSPDNPVVDYRTTVLLRQNGREIRFETEWKIIGSVEPVS